MTRWRRFWGLFGLDPTSDVDEELSFHLEMRIRELVERGESPARARELTLQRFGDFERSRAACLAVNERRRRSMVRAELISELRQDVRYALRMLRRTPGFTAVAILTLALGIGANSAIFSVVNGVLLESLPVRDADRLYRIRMLRPDGSTTMTLSAPNFSSVRADARVFERVEAYTTGTFTLLGAGEPKDVRGASISTGLFELLGLPVVLGRGFAADENHPGHTGVAVLDYGFWQREFGADPTVLGRTLSLAGDRHTVVGVLAAGARLPPDAPGARLPSEADVYVPLGFDESFSAATPVRRLANYLGVLGRARPGTQPGQVEADLQRVGRQLQTTFPDTNQRLSFNAISPKELMLGDVRRPLLVLLGAVGFVLLVACANVTNLLLARASARSGEIAVRAALGAGRTRLVRQLLTESAVLGLTGGMVGLALAYWGTWALVAAQPADIPRLDAVTVSVPVVLFTLTLALFTSLVAGIVPAWQATADGQLPEALRESGRGGGSRSGRRVRATLVVVEIALAVVLLTGSGLLIRSFIAMTRVDPGFEARQALAFRLTLQGEAYEGRGRMQARVMEAEQRLRGLPGIAAVGATTVLPFGGLSPIQLFSVVGAPAPPPDVNQEIAVASVTPEYWRAIGTTLRRGRSFTDRDQLDAPPVAIINEAAARRWFPDEDPIGRRVRVAGVREVVGVVADVLQRSPAQPAAPHIFAPYAQRPVGWIHIVVRATADPLALGPAIRAEMRALDAGLPIGAYRPLEQVIASSVARPRFYTSLLVLFAGVALALAGAGIFGVMSYGVAQRTREIGLRMALGARAPDVLRMVVGGALTLASAGVLLGLAVALTLGRVLQNQLFGVTMFDPLTLGLVVLVLFASAGAAGYLPARRAVRLDPGTVLR